MGKGTDKLYITHSEWASEDSFSASAGSCVKGAVPGSAFRRLPFRFCAVSLQPFTYPVCTEQGLIFDLTNILPWLKRNGTNPVNGKPLKSADLIKLKFAKNDDGEYVDPVTYKPFTDNTHIVALKNTGNVFAWDTIESLNIKAKLWRDLVSDDQFSRKDIIQIQDPQNLAARDLSSFKYLQDGTSTLTPAQEEERNDPANGLNLAAIGSSAKVIKAKEAVAKARRERSGVRDHGERKTDPKAANGPLRRIDSTKQARVVPYNASQHTSGKAAASFTSTGLTPHTSSALALLSDEEYMLQPRRVKEKGYARIQTTHGNLNMELNTEFAPRAVWNFVKLAKKGYYSGVAFHRNIRNFMIQGGDPTGSGRGGQSIWGKPFLDELHSPLKHNARGVVSMANKGKNTNTSQFFIMYRAASHLDNKHTIFAKIIDDDDSNAESEATLKRLEAIETDDSKKPLQACSIEEIVVFVDPFEDFSRTKEERDKLEQDQAASKENGGGEDDNMTWTGKRLIGDKRAQSGSEEVGKYLQDSKIVRNGNGTKSATEDWEPLDEPTTKKHKVTGSFGNFDGW